MNLNLTVNEAECTSPSTTSTPGAFNVRAHYNETDAGHLYGTFSTKEAAEKCVTTLAARADVIKATIEEVA